jgi:hypothetical protein
MNNRITFKGTHYFELKIDAEKIRNSLIGKEIYHFGNKVKAEPRIVKYQLGYAIQYIKAGAYYPNNTKWQKNLKHKGNLFYLNDFKLKQRTAAQS